MIGPDGFGKSTNLAGIYLAFAAPVSCMGKPSLKSQHLIKSSKEELEVSVYVVLRNLPRLSVHTVLRTHMAVLLVYPSHGNHLLSCIDS